MNWRSGIANAAVISTAARLLAERQLTFSSVYDARLAFDLYDHEQDHEGIFLKDLHNISRALKLCKRALGPVQLRSELRRITGSPVMPSRIQLHEFLHLLLSCAPLVTPTVHDAGSTDKDARDLYRLADFRKMLTPEDRQRQQTLDAQRHWKLARIKLNINATIVRDMVDRRNMPQTRVWDVEDPVDVTHEVRDPGSDWKAGKKICCRWWRKGRYSFIPFLLLLVAALLFILAALNTVLTLAIITVPLLNVTGNSASPCRVAALAAQLPPRPRVACGCSCSHECYALPPRHTPDVNTRRASAASVGACPSCCEREWPYAFWPTGWGSRARECSPAADGNCLGRACHRLCVCARRPC